jgi:hypothetical protein
MKTLPLIGFLAACCAMSTLWAAEAPPAKPAATPAATPAPAAAKPAATESATPKSDEDSGVKEGDKAADKAAAGKPKPAASAADKSSPQRFVPSEQVRADFDVSFPIDI